MSLPDQIYVAQDRNFPEKARIVSPGIRRLLDELGGETALYVRCDEARPAGSRSSDELAGAEPPSPPAGDTSRGKT